MNSDNPYVGPRSFKVGEMLYGRDDEARRLFDLLVAERIVLLYSPSGAGKTSLIHARLIPKLQREGFCVLPPIRVRATCGPGVGVHPANRYVFGTLLSLEKAYGTEAQIPVEELAALDIGAYLHRRQPEGEEPIALLFDQFEEVLTLDPTDRPAKHAFFHELGAALRNPRYWALFAMREDNIAALETYVQAVPTRMSNRFRLDFLDQEHAAEAIRKPAADRGVKFTAAEKLAEDLSQILVQQLDGTVVEKPGGPVEPVQLQVVCRRIWEKPRQKPDEISAEDLHLAGAGDVDSALAEYYDERVQAIAAETGVGERAIREWFDKLITERGTRGQLLRGAETSEGLQNNVIDALERDYVIRPEDRRGATWYELAHDRLVEPIRTSNASWVQKNLSPLQSAAMAWEGRKGTEAGVLLRDDALVAAERWARANREQLAPREEAFLNACRGALTDFERAAVDWELGGRQPDQLLAGAILEEALEFKKQAGEAAFTDSERALLARSVVERRRARYRKALLVGFGATGFLLFIIAFQAISTQRQLVSEIRQREALLRAKDVAVAQKERIESSSKAALSAYTLSDAATSTAVDVSQRLEAQARIIDLLPTTTAGTRATRIDYYAKPDDGEKLQAALRDLPIPIHIVPPKTTNVTNAVWYGTDVPEKDVRLVAYALIRAGVALQGIQRMSDDYIERNPQYRSIIQIGRDPSLADQPAFVLDAIDKMPIVQLQRLQAHDEGLRHGAVVTFDRATRQGTLRIDGEEGVIPFQAPTPSLTFAPGDPVSFELFSRPRSIPRGRYVDNVRPSERPSPAPDAPPQTQTQTE